MKKSLIFKVLSVVLVLSVLSVSLLISASAEDVINTKTYQDKVVSINNFDTASAKQKTAMDDNVVGVSETALSNGSNGYMYFNNTSGAAQSKTFSITVTENSPYTVSFDFYILNKSTATNVLAVHCIGKEDYCNNAHYNLYQWYHYEKTFTASNASAGLKIFAYQGAKILFDNVKVTDESGSEILNETFTSFFIKSTYIEHKNDVEILDLLGETETSSNRTKYLSLNRNGSTSNTANYTKIYFPAAKEDTGTVNVRISFKYRLLKKAANSTSDIVLNLCGCDPFVKPDLGVASNEWKEANVYISNNFDTTTLSYLNFGVYGGVHIEIDDLRLCADVSGLPVFSSVDFESTANYSSEITHSIINNREVLNKYLSANNTSGDVKPVKVYFPAAVSGTGAVNVQLTFRYRLLNVSNSTNELAFKLEGSNDQVYMDLGTTAVNEWTDGSKYISNTFNTDNLTFLTIYVYGGVNIEIDDLKLHVNNGGGAVFSSVDFESDVTVTGSVAAIKNVMAETQCYPWYDNTNGVLAIDATSANKSYYFTNELESGKIYSIDFKYYQSAPSTKDYLFRICDSNGTIASISNSDKSGWQEYSFTFIADDSKLLFLNYSGSVVYIDDIVITELSAISSATYKNVEGVVSYEYTVNEKISDNAMMSFEVAVNEKAQQKLNVPNAGDAVLNITDCNFAVSGDIVKVTASVTFNNTVFTGEQLSYTF